MMATAKKTTEKATETVNKTAEKTAEIVSKTVEETNGSARPVIHAAHSVFLAGLGVFALGKEEIGSAFEQLVEKGEITENDTREMVNEWLERGKKDMSKAEDKLEGVLDERIEGALNRMNIPNKSDIDSLGRKVTNLSKKVNALDKKLAEEQKAA